MPIENINSQPQMTINGQQLVQSVFMNEIGLQALISVLIDAKVIDERDLKLKHMMIMEHIQAMANAKGVYTPDGQKIIVKPTDSDKKPESQPTTEEKK